MGRKKGGRRKEDELRSPTPSRLPLLPIWPPARIEGKEGRKGEFQKEKKTEGEKKGKKGGKEGKDPSGFRVLDAPSLFSLSTATWKIRKRE